MVNLPMPSARRHAERHPTGPQLRAARGLLNMSVSELAELTHLALNTIKRAEGDEGHAPITAANAMLLVSTLEDAGVMFIAADERHGAGVRLADTQPATTPRKRRRRSAKD